MGAGPSGRALGANARGDRDEAKERRADEDRPQERSEDRNSEGWRLRPTA